MYASRYPGIDVNAKNKNGWTALMSAAYANSKESVAQLLQFDIDVNAKNKTGETALDLAKNEEIKELIEEYIFKSTAGKIKSGRSVVKKRGI